MKMEVVFDYDDKTGTWSEAPEVYGTIECATKEDYEYAKKAIKGYIELEAKHWDECRQIAHYDDELKEAKRLLKLALPLINSSRRIDAITNLSTGKKELLKHYILDEALKLIGGSENG
jgi:hypothetical protein